jgi:hypothetical protein
MPSSTELAVGQRCDPIARVLIPHHTPICDLERADPLPKATSPLFFQIFLPCFPILPYCFPSDHRRESSCVERTRNGLIHLLDCSVVVL